MPKQSAPAPSDCQERSRADLNGKQPPVGHFGEVRQRPHQRDDRDRHERPRRHARNRQHRSLHRVQPQQVEQLHTSRLQQGRVPLPAPHQVRHHHRHVEQHRRHQDGDEQQQRHAGEEAPTREAVQHPQNGAVQLRAGQHRRHLFAEAPYPPFGLPRGPALEALGVDHDEPHRVYKRPGVGGAQRVYEGRLSHHERGWRLLRVVLDVLPLHLLFHNRRVEEHPGAEQRLPVVVGGVYGPDDAGYQHRDHTSRAQLARHDHLVADAQAELVRRLLADDGLGDRPDGAVVDLVAGQLPLQRDDVVSQIRVAPHHRPRGVPVGRAGRRQRVPRDAGQVGVDEQVSLAALVDVVDILRDRVRDYLLAAVDLRARQHDVEEVEVDVGGGPPQLVDLQVEGEPLQRREEGRRHRGERGRRHDSKEDANYERPAFGQALEYELGSR